MNIGQVTQLEVAPAGDPVSAVVLASSALRIAGGQVVNLTVRHDDGCPCLHGKELPACTCEIIGLEARRVA